MALKKYRIGLPSAPVREGDTDTYTFRIDGDEGDRRFGVRLRGVRSVEMARKMDEAFAESLRRHLIRRIRRTLEEGLDQDGVRIDIMAWSPVNVVPEKECDQQIREPQGRRCRLAAAADALRGATSTDLCDACRLPEAWLRCAHLQPLTSIGEGGSAGAPLIRRLESRCALAEPAFDTADPTACWALPCYQPPVTEIDTVR